MKQEVSFFSVAIPKLGQKRDISLLFSEERIVYGEDKDSIRLRNILLLAFLFLDEKRLMDRLHSWGWKPRKDDFHQEGLHRQFSWKNKDYVRCFWAGQRTIHVNIKLALGSSTLGWIRENSKHHLGLLHGIMEDPHCSFQFSIHMDSMFSLASCSYTDVAFGSYIVSPADQIPWLSIFFEKLQGLVVHVEDVDPAELAYQALLSVEDHRAYHDFCTSLESIGEIRVVKLDGHPKILCSEELLDSRGSRIRNIVQDMAAVHLSRGKLLITQRNLQIQKVERSILCFTEKGPSLGVSRQERSLAWPTKT